MTTEKKKSLVTPEGRVSFPDVFKGKPSENDPNTTVREVTLLIPKTQNIDVIKNAVRAAVEAKWPDAKKRPGNLALPIRDGDTEKPHLDGYAGHWFMAFRCRNRVPGLVDASKQAIVNPDEFYAGCFARVSFDAYAYDNAKKKGVSLGLNNIMKTKEGARFGNAVASAEDDFADVRTADQDDLFN